MLDLASTLVDRQELGVAEIAAINGGAPALRIRLLARRADLGETLRNMESALESSSMLDPTVREIVILTALRRSESEVQSRLPVSRQRGVTEEMLEAILDEDWTDPVFNPAQKAAFQFALQYDAGHLVNDAVIESVRAEFADAAWLEMAVVCGQYGAFARLAVGFRLDRLGK